MKRHVLPLALLASLAAPAIAAQDGDTRPTPGAIADAAPESEWRRIADDDLLVMTLAPDAQGEERRIVMQLLPEPFSQGWVGNVRLLARDHWWDGTSVYRVVDNWVTQWGDGEDERADPKPLPDGIVAVPERDYVVAGDSEGYRAVGEMLRSQAIRRARLAAVPVRDGTPPPVAMEPAPGIQAYGADPYAPTTGFYRGWPVAMDADGAWPTHCYGMIGVARDLTPDTGTGAELYTVIGHAPRQLDRNIALVGRVIAGMEHLSTLPRGKGPAGVYADEARHTPIVSVRLARELPPGERPAFEYLDTASDSFARYLHVRANRDDSFYQYGAGGVDVCNVQVPIRPVD
ncbi:peptidylprolyl isomerase [Croceicoccus sp. YJ47]|uniref:peptidylprolyl isomerase n=1 Tax=Croceicoccus sp. YJ47 TaxID=2798724 RepID=UPI001921F58B|nr:peptidylprolyl isomerase [Croceicoccus sp. YJ47]QQN74562.1 peptidylprolyl isomerase [Croceicoccus sp. YJ47]